jgi:hypothetical protein
MQWLHPVVPLLSALVHLRATQLAQFAVRLAKAVEMAVISSSALEVAVPLVVQWQSLPAAAARVVETS